MYLGGSLVAGFIVMLLIDQIFYNLKDKFGVTSNPCNINKYDAEAWEQLINPCEHDYVPLHSDPSKEQNTNVEHWLNNENTEIKNRKVGSFDCYKNNGIATHTRSIDGDNFERWDGNKAALTVSTTGLVVHAFADGIALGSSCFAL